VSGWDDLVTTALLGTQRRSLPDSLPAAVARLATTRSAAAPSLLDAAAGYVSYRGAGARPDACPVPDPAPRQVVDLAPETAQILLRRLLDAGEVALVDEWLTECVQRGLGVRAGLWTVLATAAAASTGPDRSLVRAALGQRGLAFLRLNPEWRSVLRPARPAEPAVGAASGGARPAWSETATRTALGALQVTRSLGRRRVIVETSGADLQQAVAHADLDAWPRHTGLPPGPLLDLLRSSASDHIAALTAGLAEAAVRQQHPAWATALARAGHVTPQLVALVPPAEHDALARSWVEDGHDAARAAPWLALLPGPWSEPVTAAGLRVLATAGPETPSGRRLGRVLAHRAPLSAHEHVRRVAQQWPTAHSARPAGLAEAARLLALRVEIRHAFDATAPTEETT